MIFRYPGAKNKLLPYLSREIYPMLSDQKQYLEPFLGGGSVMLDVAKSFPNIAIIGNDLDARIAAFWRVIGGDTEKVEKLIKMLDIVPSVEMFFELRSVKEFDDLTGAFLAVFFNRTAFSGILDSGPIGGYDQSGKYKITCRYNHARISKDILAIHAILRGRFVMLQEDALQVISNNTCPMYIDPPYFDKGDELYTEKVSRDEHAKLAGILRNKSGWVLSYDNAEEITAMYSWANIQPIRASYTVSAKAVKTELVIMPTRNSFEQLRIF